MRTVIVFGLLLQTLCMGSSLAWAEGEGHISIEVRTASANATYVLQGQTDVPSPVEHQETLHRRVDPHPDSLHISRRALVIVFGLFLLAALSIAMVVIWNHTLKHEVGQRIVELQEELLARLRAEEILQESERRLATLMGNLPGMAYRCANDPDWTMRFVSEGCLALTGYAPWELIANRVRSYGDLLHPEDRSWVWESIQSSLARHEYYRLTYRIIRRDGQERWVWEQGQGVFSQDGTLEAMEGYISDITVYKRVEEAMRLDEERLEALLELTHMSGASESELTHFAMEAAVRLTNSTLGYIAFTNKDESVLTMYAWSQSALKECAIKDKPLTYPVVTTGLWGEAVRQRRVIITNDYAAPNPLKKGLPEDHVPIRRHMNAPTFDGDRIVIVAGVGNKPTDYGEDDIRQLSLLMSGLWTIIRRKRAEEERDKLQAQLIQAQKLEAIGTLAGGVAHDFNNMLSVILGHTEIALTRLDPGQPLYADLMEIRKAGQRSTDITRQLLAFARKQAVEPKVLDLNEAVAGMLKMLYRLIGEDIELVWRPGDNLAPVKMDPSQIDQILANLCINARDAIAGVGKLTITTDNIHIDEVYCAQHVECVPGDYVLLAVSDTGCGMDKEILNSIFEPFFTTKEQGKGTGLGLSTVYGIVKQNNGFINVYSEPDQGTTFRIYLPRFTGKAEQSANMAVEAVPTARGGETILLTEDEPAILNMTMMMLERLGYTVLAAPLPGEAIRLAEAHAGRIDLLLTDVIMPEMNGQDLVHYFLSRYPNLKSLFMSGYTTDVIAHHGLLASGVHFIQKPFSFQDLAVKIREVLDSPP